MLAECDQEIESQLNSFASQIDLDKKPLPPPTSSPRRGKGNEPNFDLRGQMYRLIGTDLTQIDGISAVTAQIFFSEIGQNLDKFPTKENFTSWLGLCPSNKISGGKILSSRTRPGLNRFAQALKMAAMSLWHSQSYLGGYFRRMRAKHGGPKAITATAHKLARIIYVLVKTGTQFDKSVFNVQEKVHQKQVLRNLENKAKILGFQLVPCQ